MKMKFLSSSKNSKKPADKNFSSDSSSELNFETPVEQRKKLSPENVTSIYGGESVATMPISPTAFSPTRRPHFSDSLTAERASPWSGSFQALLDQPPATLPQRLIIGGIVFCLAFVAWAWFGTVEEVGKARGKLVPEGETYKIEPIELDKVSQIFVKEGQRVEAGQLLVKLDPKLAEKEVEGLQQMLKAYEIELSQKQVLQERVELEAKTQRAISDSTLMMQRATIALAREKKATLVQLLAQQRQTAAAYRTRQIQRQSLSTIAQEMLRQLHQERVVHRERLERLRSLEKEGAISREFIFQAEQAVREADQRLTASKLQEMTNADEQRFQADQGLRDLKAQITQNQGDLLRAITEIQQAQAELVAQEAEARRIQLEASQKIQQLEVEITQLQAKISEATHSLNIAKTKLQDKHLRAPIRGTVLSLNLKNEGEVVEPGQTLAEIAPDNVPLVVSAVLPNQEAGFVKPGMPVQVKLDAYPYQDYGIIPGQVTQISADSETDEQLGEIYRLEVKLEQDGISKNQQVIPFKAGQTVSADIIIRNRRIIDVLLDPIKQIQKDGIDL